MSLTNDTDPYVSCVNLSGMLGSVTMAIEEGGVKVSMSTDEMSNSLGYGYYEDAATLKKGDVDLKIAWKAATGIQVGVIYDLLINTATMPTFTSGVPGTVTPVVTPGPVFAGKVRITGCDAAMLNTKAGFHLSFTGTTQGPYVLQV